MHHKMQRERALREKMKRYKDGIPGSTKRWGVAWQNLAQEKESGKATFQVPATPKNESPQPKILLGTRWAESQMPRQTQPEDQVFSVERGFTGTEHGAFVVLFFCNVNWLCVRQL